MKAPQRRRRKPRPPQRPAAAPTFWQIVWSNDEADLLGQMSLTVCLGLATIGCWARLAFVTTVEQQDQVLALVLLVASLLSLLLIWFWRRRVKKVQRLFATGELVPAKIKEINVERMRRFRTRTILRLEFILHGKSHEVAFHLENSAFQSLGEDIWLYVDPADPSQAIIEGLYR